MLRMTDLSVNYGNSPLIIKDFNLQVKPGEIVGLVGESGSGKTTVIRSIIKLLGSSGNILSGDIIFKGKPLLKLGREKWRQIRGPEISMIFQDSGAMMDPVRTIGSQFVEYICTHKTVSKKEARDMAIDMLGKVHLLDTDRIMKSYSFQLSGGMKQRIGIALAMVLKPALLLADEPTSALDVTTQAQIVRQVMEMRDVYGASIILITHNISVAAYMCDTIHVMKDGLIIESGDREKILRHPQHEYTKSLLSAVPRLQGKRYD